MGISDSGNNFNSNVDHLLSLFNKVSLTISLNADVAEVNGLVRAGGSVGHEFKVRNDLGSCMITTADFDLSIDLIDQEIGVCCFGFIKLPAGAVDVSSTTGLGQDELDRLVLFQADEQVVGRCVSELHDKCAVSFLGEGRGGEDGGESGSELFHCSFICLCCNLFIH